MIEWIKALHVLAVISWMAGMLYLPRLFVYHVDAERGSVVALDPLPANDRIAPAIAVRTENEAGFVV